ELADEVGVGAGRLLLLLLQVVENVLDPVDGGQDHRDGLAGHRHALAELAHQRLGGVRQRLEARQAEETAGPLDGMDEAENVVEDLGVIRILLEMHELDGDRVQALAGFGQKFTQQVVHRWQPSASRHDRTARHSEAATVCWETLYVWLRRRFVWLPATLR